MGKFLCDDLNLRKTIGDIGVDIKHLGSCFFRYILVYPQGCDVCNHLSLFLCVADYDKLLPGIKLHGLSVMVM